MLSWPGEINEIQAKIIRELKPFPQVEPIFVKFFFKLKQSSFYDKKLLFVDNRLERYQGWSATVCNFKKSALWEGKYLTKSGQSKLGQRDREQSV